MTTLIEHLPAKLCTRCKVSKPRVEFSERWQKLDSGKKYRASNAYCKPCQAELAKMNYEKRGAALMAAAQRKSKLKTVYGLTLEDYDRMLADQGGGCAICGTDRPGGPGRFNVDHCHHTGSIRGLLCVNCNRGIGALKDDTGLLRKAISYLDSYKES